MIIKPDHSRFWRYRDIDGLEVRYSHFAHYRFAPHMHDTWSIGLIDAGACNFDLAGKSQQAVQGDVVIIPPGDVHDCNPAGGAWAYRMFYFSDEYMRRVLADNGASQTLLQHQKAVLKQPELFKKLNAVQQQVAHCSDSLAIQQGLLEALLYLHQPEAQRGKESPRIAKAKEYLAADLGAKADLQQLAAELELSPYYFIRLFKRHTGLSPHAWRLQKRLNRAKQLILQGQTLSDVALTLGFTDQSHFSHSFYRSVGATPGCYQNAEILPTPLHVV